MRCRGIVDQGALGLLTGVCLVFIGCRAAPKEASIVGTWECTDLSRMEHVSQFAKATLRFEKDGNCVSTLTDDDGKEIVDRAEPYTIDDGRVSFGENPNTLWRYEITGNVLKMTVERSVNPEDIGLSLLYRRKGT